MEPEELLAASDFELSQLLGQFDTNERDDRIRRLRKANDILAERVGEGFWHSGGEEATWLLAEAKDCYVYGFPIASLLASHAACERRLAGIMAAYPDDRVPPDWQAWGLSRLIKWTRKEGHLPDPFVSRLKAVAQRRNAVGHYRRPVTDDSVISRVITDADAAGYAPDLAAVLEADALHALRTAYDLYSALSRVM